MSHSTRLAAMSAVPLMMAIFLTLVVPVAAHALDVDVATVTIILDAKGVALTGIEADIQFNPNAVAVRSCSLNPAIGNKSLATNLIGSNLERFIVFGINQDLLPEGVLVNCSVAILPGTTTPTMLTLQSISASNPQGTDVPLRAKCSPIVSAGPSANCVLKVVPPNTTTPQTGRGLNSGASIVSSATAQRKGMPSNAMTPRIVSGLNSAVSISSTVAAQQKADPVVGDINGDCAVNVLDVQLLVDEILGVGQAPPAGACGDWPPDLNADGSINVLDLQLLVNVVLGVSGPITISALDQISAQPFAVLTLTGTGFDATASPVVQFSSINGYSIQMPAIAVTSTSMQAVVPPYADPGTGGFASSLPDGVVVQVIQTSSTGQSLASNPVGPFQIQDLPTLPANIAPGALTITLMQAVVDLAPTVITSSGSFNSALAEETALIQQLLPSYQALSNGTSNSFVLGTVGGTSFTFHSSDLVNSDRLILGVFASISAAAATAQTSSLNGQRPAQGNAQSTTGCNLPPNPFASGNLDPVNVTLYLDDLGRCVVITTVVPLVGPLMGAAGIAVAAMRQNGDEVPPLLEAILPMISLHESAMLTSIGWQSALEPIAGEIAGAIGTIAGGAGGTALAILTAMGATQTSWDDGIGLTATFGTCNQYDRASLSGTVSGPVGTSVSSVSGKDSGTCPDGSIAVVTAPDFSCGSWTYSAPYCGGAFCTRQTGQPPSSTFQIDNSIQVVNGQIQLHGIPEAPGPVSIRVGAASPLFSTGVVVSGTCP